MACFNPRTRDGCESVAFATSCMVCVSIHAPVMGANIYVPKSRIPCQVSIHAPVMGAKYFLNLVMSCL